jgi:hypothetical protein
VVVVLLDDGALGDVVADDAVVGLTDNEQIVVEGVELGG